MKKIDVIYADPPWKYNDRKNTKTRFGGGAMKHYPTMTLDEICELGPLLWNKLSDNALLFLWTTGPYLMKANDVIESWGFEYVTVAFSWFKTDKEGERFRILPGNYTGSNVEWCLLGRRGKALKPAVKLIGQAFEMPVGRHSEKPIEVPFWISRMYPKQTKLEMFARANREWPTWKYHGDELAKAKNVVEL